MAFQVYAADGSYIGGIETPGLQRTTHALSQAGTFEVSAPYTVWRALMDLPDFGSYYVALIGPHGEELLVGRWLNRSDDLDAPGNMLARGNDLLEELRREELPLGYYVTTQPVLSVLADLLSFSGTGWSLGDTSAASNGNVSANLEGDTYLAAAVSLCSMTGNYFRARNNRTIDVFAVPPNSEPVATLVCAVPDDELPPTFGRVVEPKVDVDASEVLRAVFPEGGTYNKEDEGTDSLRPVGDETLPDGFSFQRIGGALAIVNDAVVQGLLRSARFDAIEPLSNTEASASGTVEASGPGYVTCEALRRPNNNFWVGGVLKLGEGAEYPVTGHSGDTVTGSWGTLAVGSGFSVRRKFEYDPDEVAAARQTLVDAAVGHLKAHDSYEFQLTLAVHNLRGVIPCPGDVVRLECLGYAALEDALTAERSVFTWDDFAGDLVVISVSTEAYGEEIVFLLDLSNELRLLPTDEGLREIQEMQQPQRLRVLPTGTRYSVNVSSGDAVCGANSYQATCTFGEVKPAAPILVEAVALDEDYEVVSAAVTYTGITVCVERISGGAFDACVVLVTVREP